MPIKDAVEQFEAQMRARTQDAVLLSRQACLDAYDLVALDSTSPLVSRRAIVQTPGTRSQS
jgi:type IV secretory pathway TrbF-like protein